MSIFGVPVFTFVAALSAELASPSGSSDSEVLFAARRLMNVLLASPFVTTLFLLLGVPLALRAAAAGLGGWMVAVAAGGLLAGLLLLVLIGLTRSGPGLPLDNAIMLSVGMIHGAAFWLGARLAAPHLFRGPNDPGWGRA